MIHLLCIGFVMQKVSLQDGTKLQVVGSGPPVLFSSGLYGLMPSNFYNKVTKKLQKEFTLVLPTGGSVIKSKYVNEVVDLLNVEKIGFMSHSSLDTSILENPLVHKAVTIDPVSLPSTSPSDFLQKKQIEPSMSVLLVKTGLSQTKLPFKGFDVQINAERVLEFPKIGHTDILDDFWADIADDLGVKGVKSFPNIEGDAQTFHSWTFRKDQMSKVDIRQRYRDILCKEISTYFLSVNLEVLA